MIGNFIINKKKTVFLLIYTSNKTKFSLFFKNLSVSWWANTFWEFIFSRYWFWSVNSKKLNKKTYSLNYYFIWEWKNLGPLTKKRFRSWSWPSLMDLRGRLWQGLHLQGFPRGNQLSKEHRLGRLWQGLHLIVFKSLTIKFGVIPH
jgi:hypothetical protein